MNHPAPQKPIAPDEGDGSESLVVRFGSVAFGSLIAAIFGALPAIMRMGGDVRTILMLVAVLVVPSAILTSLFIFARQSLRSFATESESLVASLLLWGSAMAGAGAVVGMVLRATTHHWALSAVTFALTMLMAAPAIALFVRRLATLASASALRLRLYLGVSGVAFIVTLIVLSLRIGHGQRDTAAVILDVTAWVLGALLGSTPVLRQVRPMSYVAPPLCVVIALVGLRFANGDRLYDAKQKAPAFGALLASVPGVRAR